jgi:non-specific serine/threonine protein kinase
MVADDPIKLAQDVELYLRQLAAVVAAAGQASEPEQMAAALAEAQRVTAWGLRAAVELGRASGLSWRQLAETLDVPASTLHRQYQTGGAILSAQDSAPIPPNAADLATPNPIIGRPPALDAFVGRHRELADLTGLLAQHRLVTVTGPAGVGKTRFVAEFARDITSRYPGGVWWTELAAIRRPWQVGSAVLAASGGRDLPRVVLDATSAGPVLLVLDNCEHLLDGVVDVVNQLRAAAPGLRILTTSREVLGAPGEVVMPLDPLPSATAPGVVPRSSPAVQLFADRARGARPDLDLDDDGATVAEICDQLDGLPLAIELAARQIDVLSPARLLDQLTQRLHLLVATRRGSAARHDSLRAAISWSYDLLDETARAVFTRLCILPGGFDQHTAAAVTADLELTRAQLWALLADLARKSMTATDRQHPGRFRILESVRMFGLEELTGAGGLAATQLRLIALLTGYARELAAQPWGTTLNVLSQRIAAEMDNLQYAVDAAATAGHPAFPDLALLLAAQLLHRPQHAECQNLLGRILDSSLTSRSHRRTALEYLAESQARTGIHPTALRHCAQALDIARSEGEPDGLHKALLTAMVVRSMSGDHIGALAAGDEAIQVLKSTGRSNLLGRALNNQAHLLLVSGDTEAAAAAIEEAIATYNASAGGESPLAHRFASRWGLVLLHTAAQTATIKGDEATANEYITAILTSPFHERNAVVGSCECAAIIAARRGDPARALTLLAGAATIEHTVDDFWAGHLGRAARTARKAAGPAVVQTAVQTGAAMTIEQLTEFAVTGTLPAEGGRSTNLTPREYAVAQHAARGLTNARIAEVLRISERTVAGHLASLRAKLKLRNRVEVGVWVSRQSRR